MNKAKRVLMCILLLLAALATAACGAANGGGSAEPGGGSGTADGEPAYQEANAATARKIIYTVTFSFEAADVDKAVRFVKSKLSADVGEWSADEELTDVRAYLKLRIKTERLDEFVESLEGGGKIYNFIKKATDISLDYFDKQGRIDTLIAERDILLELMAGVGSVYEQLSIAERLAAIQQDIDSLQTALNNYDSEIEYSVVTVYFTEKYIREKDPTYGEQVGGAFSGGMNAFAQFFKAIFIALAAAFPFLLLFGAIITVILLVRRRRLKAKERAKSGGRIEHIDD